MADKKPQAKGNPKVERTQAEQAKEAQGSPVPGGVQVSPSADDPRRVQDVEGNPVDEPLDPKTGRVKRRK